MAPLTLRRGRPLYRDLRLPALPRQPSGPWRAICPPTVGQWQQCSSDDTVGERRGSPSRITSFDHPLRHDFVPAARACHQPTTRPRTGFIHEARESPHPGGSPRTLACRGWQRRSTLTRRPGTSATPYPSCESCAPWSQDLAETLFPERVHQGSPALQEVPPGNAVGTTSARRR
jgi:hypothetical protein